MSLLSAAIQLIRSGFTPQMPGFMQYAQKLGETDSMPPAATDIGNVYPDYNGGYNRGLEPGQSVPIRGGDWRTNASSTQAKSCKIMLHQALTLGLCRTLPQQATLTKGF